MPLGVVVIDEMCRGGAVGLLLAPRSFARSGDMKYRSVSYVSGDIV